MVARNLDDEFDTLKADLNKLRGDIATLSQSLKGVTSDTVKEQIETIRARIDDFTGEARERGQRSLDDLTESIEDRPLTSVLVAFGVGILLGRLLDR